MTAGKRRERINGIMGKGRVKEHHSLTMRTSAARCLLPGTAVPATGLNCYALNMYAQCIRRRDPRLHVCRVVDSFVKDAEQFDDLTMLCLEYKGKQEG